MSSIQRTGSQKSVDSRPNCHKKWRRLDLKATLHSRFASVDEASQGFYRGWLVSTDFSFRISTG
ncbi:MAG: hypothetical protein K9K68_06475, partial [Methylococcaceae bacterium]|nr:hypothetical protein [Methylococcaceae bacterium]